MNKLTDAWLKHQCDSRYPIKAALNLVGAASAAIEAINFVQVLRPIALSVGAALAAIKINLTIAAEAAPTRFLLLQDHHTPI